MVSPLVGLNVTVTSTETFPRQFVPLKVKNSMQVRQLVGELTQVAQGEVQGMQFKG